MKWIVQMSPRRGDDGVGDPLHEFPVVGGHDRGSRDVGEERDLCRASLEGVGESHSLECLGDVPRCRFEEADLGRVERPVVSVRDDTEGDALDEEWYGDEPLAGPRGAFEEREPLDAVGS
jgi:hypothetical protein